MHLRTYIRTITLVITYAPTYIRKYDVVVVPVQCIERVATHVVFQQVAQVLGRDMQVSGPLQTRLGPHAIYLVLSDTLCMVVMVRGGQYQR